MPTRLVHAESFSDLWSGALLPWFETLPAPQPGAELVALVPSQAAAAFLRERMATANLGIVGLKVWTPGQLRDHLLKRFFPDKRIALREDISLLVTAAAEQAEPTNLHALAVAANPDDFLRALDTLEAAGWSGEHLTEAPWQTLAAQAHEWLSATGWWSLGEAAWALTRVQGDAGISQLLIWGFSARHWNQWPLLLAGARLAQDTLFCLPPVEHAVNARSAQLWQATLEEYYGEPETVGDGTEPAGPFRALSDAFIMGGGKGTGTSDGRPEFYLVQHPLEEGRLLATLATEALAAHPKARVGLLLPPLSSAARMVSAELDRLGLSHHDTFGHFPAPSTRQRLLNAWAAWQEEPRLRHWREFARLLTELEREPIPFFLQTTRPLDAAADQLLTDFLPVLFTWARDHSSEDSGVAEALDRWGMLPECAPLELFLDVAQPALELLGWKEELVVHRLHYAPLLRTLMVPISRRAFMLWLMGLLRTPGKVRAEHGRNTLAAIQVLNYADTEGLAFDVLLCGGLAAGQWPVERVENPFLNDRRCETLNDAATIKSRSGEGASVLHPIRGLLITRALHYELSEEGMRGLLADTQLALQLSQPLHNTPGDDKVQPPGDYLLKLYHAAHGRLPVPADLTRWQSEASQKLSISGRATTEVDAPAGLPVNQTRDAFRARRDRKKPFDEYNFCFRAPPQKPVALNPRDWEMVLQRPSQIWFDRILHTSPWPHGDTDTSERKLIGTWLHQWVCLDEVGVFMPMPDLAHWQTHTRTHAEAVRSRVMALWHRMGLEPSLHWQSVYDEALESALQLADTLGDLDQWGWVAAKPTFNVFHRVAPGLPEFSTLGIDFAFAHREDGVSVAEPWSFLMLVDVTSSKTVFNTSKLVDEGIGLKLALVAWALEGGTARGVHLAVAAPGKALEPVAPPQRGRVAHQLNTLRRIAQNGAFGQLGALRDRNAYTSAYPLSTLAIDPRLLDARWELTFPEWFTAQHE
ncbi:MAG: hypothetical protein SFY80_12260 [Verrucomicrobiota bacterium]|nr:hypothetical protein [Verrucomicrobiota bacterium]